MIKIALPHLPKPLLVDLRKSAEACEAAGGWPPDDAACNTTMWYEASAQLLAHTRDAVVVHAERAQLREGRDGLMNLVPNQLVLHQLRRSLNALNASYS